MFIKTIMDSSGENGSVTVIIANESGSGEECLVLSLGAYKRMLKQLGMRIAELDEVTEELYDALHVYAEQTAALREGARILTSGDKSAKEIVRKLAGKGFSRESAEYAVEFLREKGYLSEESACLRIAEAAVRSKHYGKRRVLEYLLSRFLSGNSQLSTLNPEHWAGMKAAMAYLELHFREKITLKKLSAISGYNPTYFSEQFRKLTGETYIERLTALRINYAKALLANGLSVTDACFASGFGSLSNFLTAFKRNCGTAPSEYRNRHKKSLLP